jgi:hypothetical protein
MPLPKVLYKAKTHPRRACLNIICGKWIVFKATLFFSVDNITNMYYSQVNIITQYPSECLPWPTL